MTHSPGVSSPPSQAQHETSRDVKAFVAAEQVKIQYTPPDMHRTNPAERAVRTWKNHFTAGIVGIPPSFPIAN